MDFLGMPDVSPHVFLGLTAASLVTSFLGISTGAAGGLLLLAIMASVLPPAVLLPIHTVVQLGSGITRTLMMWRHVMRGTLPPFIIGAIIGAAAGAKIFVALPINILEGILGLFIIVATWLPRLGRVGGERTRFVVLGFGTTFLGMFVSATGTLLAPLIAGSSAQPLRPGRNLRRPHQHHPRRQARGVRLSWLRDRPLCAADGRHDRDRRGRQLAGRARARPHGRKKLQARIPHHPDAARAAADVGGDRGLVRRCVSPIAAECRPA